MKKLALVLMLLAFTGCTSFLDSAGLRTPDYYPHCYPYYCSSPNAEKCACGRCKTSERNSFQPVNSRNQSRSYVDEQVKPRRRIIKRTIREEHYDVKDDSSRRTRSITRFSY